MGELAAIERRSNARYYVSPPPVYILPFESSKLDNFWQKLIDNNGLGAKTQKLQLIEIQIVNQLVNKNVNFVVN